MRHFLCVLGLFLTPLVIFFAPTLSIFLISGEAFSPHSVEELLQGNTTVLVGPAYTSFQGAIAFDEAKNHKVIALGSSRIGQLRAAFFSDPHVFYNATSDAQLTVDFGAFVRALGTSTPEIMIVNMDQYAFNPAFAVERVTPDVSFASYSSLSDWDVALDGYIGDGAWWKVYADYLAGKYTLKDAFFRPTGYVSIGLRAHATDTGFINDGSNYYGNILGSSALQQQTRDEISAMAAGVSTTSGYEYGSSISQTAIDNVRDFLEAAKARNIFVIGFMPPMPHSVYVRMQSFPNASYQESFQTLAPELAALYRQYGFDFYDFSDPASFGSSDNEMINSNHGSEKMYLRMFIVMAQKSPRLGALADLPYLREHLSEATSTYEVFPPNGL